MSRNESFSQETPLAKAIQLCSEPIDSDNFSQGLQLLKTLAESNPDAQYLLGRVYYIRLKDRLSALQSFSQAAKQGHIQAMTDAGAICQLSGQKQTAAEWYQKAAKLGHPVAAYSLGLMMLRGDGIVVDVQQAVSLLQQAAEKNYVDAWVLLGKLHFEGTVIEKNMNQAVRCFQKAAELGRGDACHVLATLYYPPNRLLPDWNICRHWCEEGARLGHEICVQMLQGLTASMPKTQPKLSPIAPSRRRSNAVGRSVGVSYTGQEADDAAWIAAEQRKEDQRRERQTAIGKAARAMTGTSFQAGGFVFDKNGEIAQIVDEELGIIYNPNTGETAFFDEKAKLAYNFESHDFICFSEDMSQSYNFKNSDFAIHGDSVSLELT